MSRLQQIEKQISALDYEADQLRGGVGQACQEKAYAPIQTAMPGDNILNPRDPIDDVFTYHNDPAAIPHYVEIREAAKTFARVIDRHAPWGDDKRTALSFVRAAVMWANAGIALNGRGL